MIRNIVRIVTVFCALTLFAGIAMAQSGNAAPAASGTTAHKTRKKSTTPKSKQVDINSATKDKLTAVPGIDDATAQKIIAGRPFRTKRDLLTRKILTKDQYAKVKDQLVAHGGRKASAKTVSAKSK
jgi:competence protein ComEA